MKILIKIDKFNKEKNSITARFCNLKSQQSIDSFKKRKYSCKKLDNSNVINFCKSLGRYGSRNIESYEEHLPTLPENNPIELNENMSIDEIVGKVVCIEYPPKLYEKLKVRRIDL